MAIESEKAKERMADGGRGGNVSTPSGKSRDKVAEQFGISGEQARKTLFVDDHRDLLDPADFAEWDEGKLRRRRPTAAGSWGVWLQSLRWTPSRKNTLLAAVMSISHGIMFVIRIRYVRRQGIMAEQSMTRLCRMHPTRGGSSRAIEELAEEGGVGRWA